jgi:adenylate cyclase
MAVEIERKFLLKGDGWREQVVRALPIKQGYLSTGPLAAVRARVKGDRAYLTVKANQAGQVRSEFEYEIPLQDAEEMLAGLSLTSVIDKVRYWVDYEGYRWEVDEFAGDNQGLLIAEIELASENDQPPLPEWLGREVTEDQRYYNASLAQSPYCQWRDDAD